MFNHIPGLLFNPREEWKKIAHLSDEALKRQLPYFILMGAHSCGWFFLGYYPAGLVNYR